MSAAKPANGHAINRPTPATPDTNRKRLLSPTAISPSNEQLNEKKLRKDSIELDDSEIYQSEMEENKDLTKADLKKWMSTISDQLKNTVKVEDLKELATQSDINMLEDKITAQNTEITQVREELNKCQDDINKIRTQFDQAIASELDRKLKSADADIGQTLPRRVNMAAQNINILNPAPTARRNLIFQGLGGDTNDELMANIISLTSEIGVIMYKSDVEFIGRIPKRDLANKAPAPVLLTVTRVLLRDMILKKKTTLQTIPGLSRVFINADEPLDIRRGKAILRKVAYNAKNMGKQVLFKHDRVTIDDILCTLDDLHKIPTELRPTLHQDRGRSVSNRKDVMPDSNIQVDPMEEGAVGGATAAPTGKLPDRPKLQSDNQVPTIDQDTIKRLRRLFNDSEKIRVTKSGVLFSGPTAYISNMFYASVSYEGRDYGSNEQAIQCTKALLHDCIELANALKNLSNSYKIKSEAGSIVTTEQWKSSMPDRLWTLLDNKMKEHPDLLERLMVTYPAPLVEASPDKTYGGGAPFDSILYDTAEYTGDNKFGKIATKYRNQKYTEMYTDGV